jgi:hypothetical protein
VYTTWYTGTPWPDRSGSRRIASPVWLYERLAAGAVDRDERQHAAYDDIAPHAARVEAGVGVYHRLRADARRVERLVMQCPRRRLSARSAQLCSRVN